MFRLDKLTQKAQEALQHCQAVAEQNGSQVIFPLHLLIALAEEKEGIVRPVLEKCGVHPDAIVTESRRMLAGVPKTSGMQPGVYLSQPLNEIFEHAFDEAGRFKDEFVSTEHLLLALAEQRGDPAGQLLDRAGATHDAILRALVGVRGSQRVTDQNPETKYQALERYAHDLTESARKGKLDPVIGREDEIRRVMQVLSRRTKNNPVLIGEPGVGKTAIVEGLAQRIVRGDVPDQLKNKRLVAIDLGSMIAGTKFRGEFEDRLKAVVKEIIDSNGEIICFIDELHTLVGAGSAEGAIDASNLLKPALARGELRCIGATTLNEYKKHVERDAALARRFQTVMVGEPSVDDTIAILRGLKEKFEIHHGVRIKDSAIVAAAVLSYRYIADRAPGAQQGGRSRLARPAAHRRKRPGAAARRSDRPQRALEPRKGRDRERPPAQGRTGPAPPGRRKSQPRRRLGESRATALRPALPNREGHTGRRTGARSREGRGAPQRRDRRGGHRPHRGQVDRNPRDPHDGRRNPEARADAGAPEGPGHRPG
jgi:ATP-dependent Clp protease ATP-binding subunit ClpB